MSAVAEFQRRLRASLESWAKELDRGQAKDRRERAGVATNLRAVSELIWDASDPRPFLPLLEKACTRRANLEARAALLVKQSAEFGPAVDQAARAMLYPPRFPQSEDTDHAQ